jgi:hypothetical protein
VFSGYLESQILFLPLKLSKKTLTKEKNSTTAYLQKDTGLFLGKIKIKFFFKPKIPGKPNQVILKQKNDC